MLLGEVHEMIRHLMQPDGVPDPVRHPMLKHGVKPGMGQACREARTEVRG